MNEIDKIRSEYLRTDEASRVLKVSKRTLSRYIERGVIPYSKPQGQIIYIKLSHLIAFMEGKLRL